MSNQGNAQGQQAPGQRPFPSLLRTEDIQKLTIIDDATKLKYTQAFRNCWNQLETKSPESEEYKSAFARLTDWSGKIRLQHQQVIAARRNQQQGAQQRLNNPQAPEQSLQDRPQQTQSAQPQNETQQQPQQQPQAGQGQRPPNATAQPQFSQAIVNHIQQYQFTLPPTVAPGTPEAEKRLKEFKNSYALALARQEQAVQSVKRCNMIIEQRKNSGQTIPPEVMAQKAKAETSYTLSKQSIEEFRRAQATWRQQAGQQGGAQQQPGHPQAQGATAQIKSEGGGTAPGAGTSSQPVAQTNGQSEQQTQQLQQIQQPQPSQQPSQQASQNQQSQHNALQQGQVNSAGGPSQNLVNAASAKSPVSATQPPQQQAQITGSAPSQQSNPQQPQTLNQVRPPFQHTTAPAGQIHQGSPHTQGNNPIGPPRPLTHQDAVTAAARSYSDRQTPQQIPPGLQGQPVGNREQVNTSNQKWPLTKSPIPPPQPVSLGPSRPTLGGPSTGAPGMMGQPVLPKISSYVLENDNDRVLSKKKLDELVRQVTGGGEGTTGEVLTSEVEEAMLQLADDFVDGVISDACKLSKLRESPQLDIRDIQLVLERKYNIRIPGYASDEIRTVRKVQPAPGWTQKMNAVQAAKVMGGKGDI